MRLLDVAAIVHDCGPADVWLISSGAHVGEVTRQKPAHGGAWALKATDPFILDAEGLARILRDAVALRIIKPVGPYQVIYAEEFLKVGIDPGRDGVPASIQVPPSQEHG